MTTKYRHAIAILLFAIALILPLVYCAIEVFDINGMNVLPFKYYCAISIIIGCLARMMYKGKLF